ncbi:MAG: insulinase family protein [Ignavibacteriae bacterium]|nr:insulinase family protein [Ignavibacteriota bacterium]
MPSRSPASNYSSTIEKTVLPNGVRILSEFVPTVESFALGVWIDVGSRDETKDAVGIAHFIEHLAFRRTVKRSSRNIAAEFESLGAYTNAFTSKEQTCFYVRALKPHFRRTLSLLAEITLQPAFHHADIEKERTVIIEEIKSYDDEPEEVIFDCGEKSLFTNHPLGNPIAGTVESVSAILPNSIRTFHTERYNSSNIIIAVSGNIEHDLAVKVAMQHFAVLPESKPTERITPEILPPERVVITKQFQQGHLLLSKRIPGVRSEDRYCFSVLNTLLGDGMSSRLYQRIRERSGLAYSVYSSIQMMSDCGAIMLYAATEEKKVAKTEAMIYEELAKLCETKINPKELSRAQEQSKSGIIMSLESMSSRMQSMGKSELEEGFHESIATTIERVEAVTAEDILRLSHEYLAAGGWSVAEIRG